MLGSFALYPKREPVHSLHSVFFPSLKKTKKTKTITGWPPRHFTFRFENNYGDVFDKALDGIFIWVISDVPQASAKFSYKWLEARARAKLGFPEWKTKLLVVSGGFELSGVNYIHMPYRKFPVHFAL